MASDPFGHDRVQQLLNFIRVDVVQLIDLADQLSIRLFHRGIFDGRADVDEIPFTFVDEALRFHDGIECLGDCHILKVQRDPPLNITAGENVHSSQLPEHFQNFRKTRVLNLDRELFVITTDITLHNLDGRFAPCRLVVNGGIRSSRTRCRWNIAREVLVLITPGGPDRRRVEGAGALRNLAGLGLTLLKVPLLSLLQEIECPLQIGNLAVILSLSELIESPLKSSQLCFDSRRSFVRFACRVRDMKIDDWFGCNPGRRGTHTRWGIDVVRLWNRSVRFRGR